VDPSAVVQTVCQTAQSLQQAAPVVALVWIAAVLTAALVVRGSELVLTVVGITIVAFVIMQFQHLISALGVAFPC
jgi:hypothetical protein